MNIYNFIYRFKNYNSLLFAYIKNFFFYICSFSFVKKPKIKNINKILIIKFGGLGDTIICYDFINSLKLHFKTANISFCCDSRYFEYFKDINIKLINKLSNIKEADIIFDLSSKNNSQIYLKIKHKYLFLKNPIVASDYLSFKATKVFKPIFNQHITNYNSQILKELKIKETKKFKKKYNESEYFVLNLVAGKKIRYIPKKQSINIIIYLLKFKKYKIYLPYFGLSEKKHITSIIKKIKNNNLKLFNIEKENTLKLIKNAKQIITTDSGIAHVAGLYNKNNLVIFGPGNTTIWKPNGDNTKIVTIKYKCRGCQKHSDIWKCNHECLEKIELKEILSKINIK